MKPWSPGRFLAIQSIPQMTSQIAWNSMDLVLLPRIFGDLIFDIDWLVVEPTHLKNMIVKMGSSSPIFGVKIPKIFETTT